MTQHEYDKLNRRRKRLMQRQRKYMPIPQRDTNLIIQRVMLLNQKKQLNRLGLQQMMPLDDCPELENQTTKF